MSVKSDVDRIVIATAIIDAIDAKVAAGEPLLCREAILAVMRDVGVIGKDSENTQSHYLFRGVEAVVNGVQPSLLKYGVVVTPKVLSHVTGTVEVGTRRTSMGWAEVLIEFTWHGPLDTIVTSGVGAAFDSGDKAVPKASSVALRTTLTQTLMIRTRDDSEPDAVSYERSQPEDYGDSVVEPPERLAKRELWKAVSPLGWTADKLQRRFAEDNDGRSLGEASASEMVAFQKTLVIEAKLQDEAAAKEAAAQGDTKGGEN